MRPSLQFLRPPLLVKRPWAMLWFALTAALLAASADPKLFDLLVSAFRQIPLRLLVPATICVEAVALAIIWFTLETRYVVAAQSRAAAVMFLATVIFAAAMGFWLRQSLPGRPPAAQRSFGPGAYTLREGLAALIAFSVGGTFFTGAYNAVFQKKADYTQFNDARRLLLAHVSTMRTRFANNEPLFAKESEALQRHCTNAKSAFTSAASSETGSYRTFVDEWIRTPLSAVCELASSPDVSAAPELFLRACGLAEPSNPWESSYVTTMTAAYQKLERTQ